MFRSLSRELRRSLIRRDLVGGRSVAVAGYYSTGAGAAGGNKLEGKVALITGGASGLGKATAQEFVQQGAQVIIADIDSNLGPQVASNLGPAAHFVRCDVTVESDIANAVDVAVSVYGKLDVMYNNVGIAGLLYPPSIVDLDLDALDWVMKVNVDGVMAGIKHAARVMVPAGSGSIVCTSSITGLMGGIDPISRGSIPGLVRTAADELRKSGVRVNCISPTLIPTPLNLGLIGQLYPGLTEEQTAELMCRLGKLKRAKCEVSDVARAALYLASDEAKYVSGHNLVVDEGFKSMTFPSPAQIL